MHYRVVIFGVKDTTAEIVRFVQEKLCPVDLVVTIHPDVLSAIRCPAMRDFPGWRTSTGFRFTKHILTV